MEKKHQNQTHNWLSRGMMGSILSAREELLWSSEVILVLTRQPLEWRCRGRVFPSFVGDIRDLSTPSNWTVWKRNKAYGWKGVILKGGIYPFKQITAQTTTLYIMCRHFVKESQIKVTCERVRQASDVLWFHMYLLTSLSVWEPKCRLCFCKQTPTHSLCVTHPSEGCVHTMEET